MQATEFSERSKLDTSRAPVLTDMHHLSLVLDSDGAFMGRVLGINAFSSFLVHRAFSEL